MGDVEITYKSMGLWTELEVVTQTFSSGHARACIVARHTPADKLPKGMTPDTSPPIALMLSQSDMRRLALHLLMESMG